MYNFQIIKSSNHRIFKLSIVNRQSKIILYFCADFMLRKIRDIILAVVDWFYKPFRRFIPQTIFRYGFTGGMNTLLDIVLYYIL